MEMTRSVLLSLVLFLALGYAQSAGFEFTDANLESNEAKWAMYERWRAHHEVPPETYDDEQQRRFIIFMDNVNHVDTHNKAKKSYVLELNRMADLTLAEVVSRYTGRLEEPERRMLMQARNNTSRLETVDRQEFSTEIDWRHKTKLCLQRIKAIVEAVGRLERWVQSNQHGLSKPDGGAVPTDCYPYNQPAAQSVCCPAKLKNRVVFVERGEWAQTTDEVTLMELLQKHPVGACLAVYEGFHKYKEGIYTGEDCIGEDNLHALNVVGCGTTPEGCKYWIIKNSWGESWGEKGYMRLARDTGKPTGACSISSAMNYAVLKDSPNPQ